ncbi:cupin domain-containing protein [Photobacterium gaetbulicola]|uniref:cupin domain-containing protein n=1 Tax=Photobacterium gaetbulicola TaxID=1295392 RepID=UPI0005CBB7AC|nr:cupin domain-containing protein [Photobacterium gaetbulicola]
MGYKEINREIDVKSVYDGNVVRALLFSSENEPNRHIVRSALAIAKSQKGGEYHFHPDTDEVYYIIDGEGVVELEDKSISVSPDNCINIPRNTKHRIRSIGRSDLKYIAFHIADADFYGAVVHQPIDNDVSDGK